MVAEWCGRRKGRTPASTPSMGSPTTECTTAASSISSSVKGGRIEPMREASIVLPEPGGPIMSSPWLPAAAICNARFATSWPATSLKSKAGAKPAPSPPPMPAGGSHGSSGSLPWSASKLRRRYCGSSRSGTADPSGAVTSASPCPWAHMPKASRPRTGRTAPSSESSPANRRPSANEAGTCPVAARMPRAMGRSSPDPVLRRSAGARFTTILLVGIVNPAALMAARTRSRASCTAVSGMPTMAMPGMPFDTATSTVTGSASTPRSVALAMEHCDLTCPPPTRH